jgi:hypothetical protein
VGDGRVLLNGVRLRTMLTPTNKNASCSQPAAVQDVRSRRTEPGGTISCTISDGGFFDGDHSE